MTCNSRGASGGMVILWRKNYLALNFNFIGPGFVGININLKGGVYNFVNVYASCNVAERRVMWSKLIEKRKNGINEDGVWEVILIKFFVERKY